MIACASAVARTAPLLSTRGASMPQCLRAHIPFPFADAGLILRSAFQCCALSVCKPSTDVVSAEGIRSNQRANAKRRLFYA